VNDLAIELEDRPGALAEMGEALGRAGVSIEGGSVFVVGGRGVGHFLFADARDARAALRATGVRVLGEDEVVVLRLRQDQPGQLGRIARRMAESGVNIVVQYSDHDGNLILVVDDHEAGQRVAHAWTRDAATRA
jgi:hypothetical protein